MAHYAKYTISSCGAMMHHYRRDREATLERENIDRARTHENYCLGPDRSLEDIQERVREVGESAGRSVRSDAITMCDWVVTVPPDVCKEDYRSFFEGTYDFVKERYGEGNMLGGWVHMDETTPHMHVAFMPVVERDNGKLAFSAKSLVDRSDLARFHDDLSRSIEGRLGYRCQIRLDDDDRLGRVLSRVDGMQDFQMLKDEIKDNQRRLERLRQDERELGSRNQELGSRAEQLREQLGERQWELQHAQDRERQIEEAYRQRQETSQEISRQIPDAQRECESLEEENQRLEQEHSRLEEVREKLIERVRDLRERLERVLERAMELVPIKHENAPERESEGFGQVRDLADRFDRAEELDDRRIELKSEWHAVSRDFGENNKPRIDEITRELSGYKGMPYKLDCAEREMRQAEQRLDYLNEHKLRNRREIPEAERNFEHARDSYNELRQEQERLEKEREQLWEREHERESSIERAREPIGRELAEITREHDQALEELEKRYRSISDKQRQELAREMQERDVRNNTYERTKGGYERELRELAIERNIERSIGLINEVNRTHEPEQQRDMLREIGKELERLDPEERERVYDRTERIGSLSWDEIRNAGRELREEGLSRSLADSVDRARDNAYELQMEHERYWERDDCYDRGWGR